MENVNEHVGKMEAQLQQWGAKLDELAAKAQELDDDAKLDYHRRIDLLKVKYHAAESKLEECRTAGSEKWDTFKTGLESAWTELEAAFKELMN